MERSGFIIVMQHKNALGRIVEQCHREIFETETVAREQMGFMAVENKGAAFWIVEIPILAWAPRLTAVN